MKKVKEISNYEIILKTIDYVQNNCSRYEADLFYFRMSFVYNHIPDRKSAPSLWNWLDEFKA